MKLSSKNQQTGLYIYCNACKGSPKDGKCCIKDGKCESPERQVYKLRIHVPGTINNRKTIILPVRDEASAAKMALQLRSDFKHQRPIREESASGYSLFDYTLKFLEFKKSPSKNQRPVSKSTLEDYSLHLMHMTKSLISAGINTKICQAKDMNDEMAKIVFESLKKFPSSLTQKKYFGTYETFANYLIKEEKVLLANPFAGWRFDGKTTANEVIYQEEFDKLLKKIDTGDQYRLEKKSGIQRKMFYPWLKTAFSLALFTGGRRQEIPELKWTDIIPNRITGQLPGGFIILKDIKNTQILKLDATRLKPIEINLDLAELLLESGYEFMKGKDQYIIDPNQNYKRQFIKDFLSKSFAHYISMVSNRDLSFKCLRKTWFTSCAKAVGDKNASFMGGHSDKDVTLAHYINAMEAAGTNMKFTRIFHTSDSYLRINQEGKIVEKSTGEVAQLVRAQDS